MPYALDNDAFICFKNKTEWSQQLWMDMIQWARMVGQKPMWCLVPDVVCDAVATIEKWHKYSPVVKKCGWDLAFAVQDGMLPEDVPFDADVVFVGGSDDFKMRTLPMWCKNFQRVHVGRINEIHAIQTCERYGAESADGSGWFKDTRRMAALEAWVDGTLKTTEDFPQLEML